MKIRHLVLLCYVFVLHAYVRSFVTRKRMKEKIDKYNNECFLVLFRLVNEIFEFEQMKAFYYNLIEE